MTNDPRDLAVLPSRQLGYQAEWVVERFRRYSGFLNPLYEAGMSHLQIAERWRSAEARRRANFKQLQNLEHGEDLGSKAEVEQEIEELLKKSGNPWRIVVEDVEKDLFATHFTRLDGYRRMVHYSVVRWLVRSE